LLAFIILTVNAPYTCLIILITIILKPCPIPNGAAGLALLGKICRQSNRKARAVQYFRMSLQLDPFLWTSFEALSELGAENVEASEIFGVRSSAGAAGGNGSSATISGGGTLSSHTNTSTALQAKTPLQPMETPGAPAMSMSQMALRPNTMTTTAPRPNRLVRFDTPGLTPIPVNASMLPAETPVTATAPLMMSHNNNQNKAAATTTADHSAVLRRAAQVAARQYYPPSPETPMTTVTRSMRYLRGIVGEAEQQEQQPGEQGGSGSGGGGRNLFLASENQASNQAVFASGGGGPAPSHHHHHHHHHQADEDVSLEKPPAREKEPPTSKVHEILELLCTAGTAYQHLCQYRCKEALRAFQALPVRHQMTGWALHQQGRAHLELNEFAPAQRCLEFMQSKEPSRMRGLELLSTVYWHLKKEVELSHLAQRVVDWDRTAPEAWCVVGNCFSLQKDHETALVFFGRSLQLNPDFTYTHTLSGYEYMANEDFEKAITCFRQALRTDDRHYNAWYGLGAIYHRQEKFDLAEYHFQRAVSIHPTSSVLRCNLGISQYANGKAYVALDTLAEAFRLDPQNPQARFQRATIYTALHRPAEALEELKKVRDAAPREATVHFALGKVLKRLGRPDLAMKCFLTAMDLDPKDNQMIKSAMDKLDEPDVDEETMAAF
jgi:anaphase-promoting complex subunit 3